MKNEKVCKLIGHLFSTESFHDGPYPVCQRCGAHAYYDNYSFYFEWHYWPYRLFWWLYTLKRRLEQKNKKPLRDDKIPF